MVTVTLASADTLTWRGGGGGGGGGGRVDIPGLSVDGHGYSGIRGYSDMGRKGGHPWTIRGWSYLLWAYADIWTVCPSDVLGNSKVTVSSMDDSGLSTATSDNPRMTLPCAHVKITRNF